MTKKRKLKPGQYEGFYNNERLLATKDANGEVPDLFFVVSATRSLGKTYSFARTLVEGVFERDIGNNKFILLSRYKQEVGNIANGMFKSYMTDHHPDIHVQEVVRMNGVFSEIYFIRGSLGDEDREVIPAGYVIPLRAADDIKKVSSMFIDTWIMFFDEFQPSMGNRYLPNEVECLLNIHTSIARGNKQSVRKVPVVLCSNAIDIYNPYFVACDLTKKIQPNTRTYQGDGFVYEKVEVFGKAKEQAQAGLNRIFTNDHTKTAEELDNSWVNSPTSMVSKPQKDWGRGRYVATLYHGTEAFAVRFYARAGIYHINRSIDTSFPYSYNLTLENGQLNVPLIKGTDIFKSLRTAFRLGIVRISDNGVKNSVMDIFV